jgi:hypothetical protein
MRKSLLASVAAAALFASTGFAAAQGMSQGGAKGGEAPTAASPKKRERWRLDVAGEFGFSGEGS